MIKLGNLDFTLGGSGNARSDIKTNNDNFETALGDTLLRGDNLYLVGSEAILKKNAPGTQNSGDSLIFLFNAIADSLNIAQENRPKDEHEWHLWIKKNSIGRTRCETAWKEANEKIDLNQYISEELIDFLYNGIKHRLIETIFTTCIDPILELLMSYLCKVCDEEDKRNRTFRTFNFMSNAQSEQYLKSKDDNSIKLVYLWGKFADKEKDLGSTPIDFVYTEDDAMKTIAEYIKGVHDNRDKILREIFFNQRVMAIGCRFDDWKFRFFWYSLRGNLDHLSYGTVSYSCQDPQNDALYQYLETTKGLHVDNNSRQFLSKMATLMESDEMFNKLKDKRTKEANGIFISYMSEDVITTTKLFYYLTDNCKFKVWMDCNNLKAGDRYTPEIIKAIDNCNIFMPILSTSVAADLENDNLEGYYIKEWKAARGKKFIPIAIGNYDCRSKYHMKFREICGFADEDKDITIYSVNNMEKTVEALKELLSK